MNGLYYLPLGGTDEIGMNMYLYGYGPEGKQRWIMVDCGIGFPDAAQVPGVETMTPDPAFIAERRNQLDGIFITHAHEDHIGAIGTLFGQLDAPIYCTAFPAEIARRKMDEAGHSPKAINICKPNDPIKVGEFEVSFFPMTHSVPETSALIIRTPVGTVFHTADFKIDPDPVYGETMDKQALEELGKEGILALVCDSTNVFEPGRAGGEKTIQDNLRKVIGRCRGKVAATTFASNVARLSSLAEAANANERAVVVAGRAMKRMMEAGARSGAVTDFPDVITEDQARDIPDENLFYLVTGSQGEGRAAMARIAGGTHPSVSLQRGDTAIFSSKTIPGNEVEVARIYNKLVERGIEIIDSDMEDIHVSGHACRDELQEMYTLLKPKYAIPMHGERRHLREHAEMALEWGAAQSFVVTNGELLHIAANGPRIVDDVHTGRLYRDGDLIVGSMDGVVRDRKRMAMNGHLAISVLLDDSGELAVESDVRSTGAPVKVSSKGPSFDEQIAEAIDEAIESAPRKKRMDDDALEDLIAVTARRKANRLWGKKPETVVFITRLEDD